jgi:hypothetical protein
MKKTVYRLSFSIIILIILINACKKDKNENDTSKGQVEFTFSGNVQKLAVKSTSDSTVSTVISAAVVTIVDASGNTIQNAVSIPLSNLNGSYISNPIALITGNYQLTEFLLVNQNNQVIYASPLKSSKLAYLVTDPLPTSFTIQTNVVTKLDPEVISTYGNSPQDFGYATFGFNIDSTFNFLVGAFIYNATTKNYQLTTASISIYSDSTLVYTGQLSPLKKDSVGLGSSTDTLGITNSITLPAKYNSFKLVISEPNFTTYQQTFSKAQLKQYFLSSTGGPLIVILSNTVNSLTTGLVAYFPFNGDVKDYSGNGNNGIAYGTLTPTTDNKGSPNAAYQFNGVDSYVRVPDAPSLNPTSQITVAAWYYPVSFVGDGFDAIVSKVLPDFIYPYYQYQLGPTGDEYWNVPAHFGFSVTVNNKQYAPCGLPNTYVAGQWYHLVGTYDGNNVICYVNGVAISTVPVSGSGTMSDAGTDIFIGRSGNYSTYYQQYFYLPGSISDIRIYNRALSQTEVTNLYKQ